MKYDIINLKTGYNHIDIYTDGACSGNPGPGGWGAIIITREETHEYSGGIEKTTNNQMELLAVVKALSYIDESLRDQLIAYGDSVIEVYSDSSYVVNTLTKGWLKKWLRNGFKTSKGGNVSNVHLWKKLLVEIHRLTHAGGVSIEFTKVKGHSGDVNNEKADRLAKAQVVRVKNKIAEDKLKVKK